MSWFKKKIAPVKEIVKQGFFRTDIDGSLPRTTMIANAIAKSFQKTITDYKLIDEHGKAIAMDSNIQQVKALNSTFGVNVPDAQIGWYASQGFIGYQMAAMISQQWLIDKCCTMPARDAARNGYEITVNDGTEVDPKVLDYMVKMDKKYGLPHHIVELERNKRIFGIRIAMFLIDSSDPDYYAKPFNIDGVTKGSYRGITQIDPYWITPELDQESAINPSSLHFYEPTWWRINGKRIHRTHLIIVKNGEVPDILKPSYLYGGIPVPQKIFERVYAAERTANEAPMLTMSKRMTVLNVDIAAALADSEAFNEKMERWVAFQNNFGVKIIGGEETIEQYDTTLTDLDAVIMTQFQLVAAAAEVPATKLLGTVPKGFNSTGEYEEASYHEFLESIQSHDMSPLINRHHEIMIRSDVVPKFKIAPFETEVNWRPIDSPTAAELATTNLTKAQTDSALAAAGGIDGIDIRQRLINDKDSGYNGMEEMPVDQEDDSDESDD